MGSGISSPTADRMGCIGLPEPLERLRARKWDVIVVGAGHNGLTCAAYLARAGRRVLVLESRERVGGAVTLEEMWPGYQASPCAYLCGLLHAKVIDELGLVEAGFAFTPASGGLFVPFEDGSSIQLWDDDERCTEEVRRFAPADLKGWQAMGEAIGRLRDALRPPDDRDLWLDPRPTRDAIEARLGDDEIGRKILFEWSMAELLGHFINDERLQRAYLGQGVIGTNASPFDPGTASIRFHHSSGRMFGQPGAWGYVKGGMGMVSFWLCDIACASGAVVATGVPVGAIVPGEGVVLAGGERIAAPVVVSNADPRTTLRLLGKAADAGWRAQVESVPIEGCTVKVTAALRELPDFKARPGTPAPHHGGQINTPLTPDEWKAGHAAARAGQLPDRLWTELYFQTVYDPAVAPPGRHMMSVFAQYVPYRFAEGDWDSRRAEVGARAVDSIARFCSNLPGAIEALEIAGPPDLERKMGLTGGHIFHGSCLPAHMWDRRLTAQTPMPGVFLCGAGTHPGGSVIAVNGRNAAVEVLRSTKPAA